MTNEEMEIIFQDDKEFFQIVKHENHVYVRASVEGMYFWYDPKLFVDSIMEFNESFKLENMYNLMKTLEKNNEMPKL